MKGRRQGLNRKVKLNTFPSSVSDFVTYGIDGLDEELLRTVTSLSEPPSDKNAVMWRRVEGIWSKLEEKGREGLVAACIAIEACDKYPEKFDELMELSELGSIEYTWKHFASQALGALRALDANFFRRISAVIEAVRRVREGGHHEHAVGFIFGRCYREEVRRLDIESWNEACELMPADIVEDEAVADFVEQFRRKHAALDLPTFREVIALCEKDGRWPTEGDPEKYAREIVAKLCIPLRPDRRGRKKRPK